MMVNVVHRFGGWPYLEAIPWTKNLLSVLAWWCIFLGVPSATGGCNQPFWCLQSTTLNDFSLVPADANAYCDKDMFVRLKLLRTWKWPEHSIRIASSCCWKCYLLLLLLFTHSHLMSSMVWSFLNQPPTQCNMRGLRTDGAQSTEAELHH